MFFKLTSGLNFCRIVRNFTIALPILPFYAIASQHFSEEPDFSNIGQTISATRLEQSVERAPATVTTITKTEIEALSLQLPEVLRFVPGIAVGQSSNWNYHIANHGGDGLVPRRIQVLVDGVSVYLGGFAQVDWSRIPIAIQDIERIEVVRTPSTSVYGANAYQAVVSIITSHSLDLRPGGSFTYNRDQNAQHHSLQYTSIAGRLSGHATLKVIDDDGFDYGTGARDGTEINPDGYYGYDSKLGRIRLDYSFDTSEVIFQAAHTSGGLQIKDITPNQIGQATTNYDNSLVQLLWSGDVNNSHHLKLSIDAHHSSFRQYFSGWYPAIFFTPELRDLYVNNPTYARTFVNGGKPTGGTPEDDKRLQAVLSRFSAMGELALAPNYFDSQLVYSDTRELIEIQDTWEITSSIRAVYGGGYEHSYTVSKDIFNGKITDDRFYAFSNIEWTPINEISLNYGLFVEKDDIRKEVYTSPRFGVSYQYLPYHTVKAIYSVGKRTPDSAELLRDWNYIGENLSIPIDGETARIFYIQAKGNPNLVEENIKSYEIALIGRVAGTTNTYQIRVFRDYLDDLISEKPNFSNFNLTNNHHSKIRGFEAEFSGKISPQLRYRMAYAYLDSHTNHFNETLLAYRHQGSLYFIYTGDTFDYSFSYTGSDKIFNESFDRYDIGIAMKIRVNSHRLRASLHLTRGPEDMGYNSNETDQLHLSYTHQTTLRGEIKISF